MANHNNDSLSIITNRNGTWITFTASGGKTASLNIETLAEHKPGIIGMALRRWCKDRQAERKQTECPCEMERSIDPWCAVSGQCQRTHNGDDDGE